jgi:hypothetical protein
MLPEVSERRHRGGAMWWNAAVDVAPLLVELFDRIPPLARQAVEGLDAGQLTAVPSDGVNPIGWLVWHAARVQDHHVGELSGLDQVWESGDWADRFGLDPDPSNTGYGHTWDEVRAVRPDGPEVAVEYVTAVSARTAAMLAGLAPGDLDRVVDRRWDPPVTMGVRLVSIADDDLQHLGQARYARGLLGF